MTFLRNLLDIQAVTTAVINWKEKKITSFPEAGAFQFSLNMHAHTCTWARLHTPPACCSDIHGIPLGPVSLTDEVELQCVSLARLPLTILFITRK